MDYESGVVVLRFRKTPAVVEIRVVGGWLVDLERDFRMRLERARKPAKLPPLPDDDPE